MSLVIVVLCILSTFVEARSGSSSRSSSRPGKLDDVRELMDMREIEGVITRFEHLTGDYANNKTTAEVLEDFYNENLTEDFVLDFLGIFQLSPLATFIPGFITILDQNKILSNIPGAFDYISLNESVAVVRNNELVTSVDFPNPPQFPDEFFECLQFTNIWTLTRDKPFKNNPWKLKRFGTVLDIRWPVIGNGTPAEAFSIAGPNNHDGHNHVENDGHNRNYGQMNFSEKQVYFVILCLSILVILLMLNTFCLFRHGWIQKRRNDGEYKYSGVKTIVSSDEDFDDLKEINV